MTTKKESRVKVNKLKLNKETVKDLTDAETKKVQGGNTIRVNNLANLEALGNDPDN